jgi:natural product biosynthesis luciferase-like monooxygenase protein
MSQHAADQQVRCAFIGDESLTVECASIALAHGLAVAVVVSSNPQVLDAAGDLGIVTLDARLVGSLADALRAHDIDVLLSVAYQHILPDAVLSQARTCINFHDGPLPEYGGLNVTTWAIANGETRHAVTWHLMTSQVDQGDLVATEEFDIASDDTAFSLNARCYEAGLTTFPAVAAALAEGSLWTSPQPDRPRRTYRRRERPRVLVDPRGDLQAIERGVRALAVGEQRRNPVGAARWILGGNVVTVGTARLAPPTADAAPGTVLGIDDAGVRVRGLDADLVLGDLRTPDGIPLTPAELAARHRLTPGCTLPGPEPAPAAALAELDAVFADHEAWWWDQIGRADPRCPPLLDGHEPSVELPLDVRAPVSVAELTAAAAIWTAAVTGTEDVTLGWSDRAARDIIGRLDPLAQAGLLCTHVAPATTVADTVAAVGAAIDEVARHGPFLRDLVGRDPARRGRPVEPFVAIDAEVAPHERLPDGAWLRLVHHAGDGTVTVRACAEREAAERIASQLAAVLNGLREDPGRPVLAVPLLGAADRALLARINDTQLAYERSATIDELFRRQVAAHPNAAAVSCGSETLTYGQLAQRVDLLAARLVEAGVQARDTVGIALERSIDMVAAVLAVLDRGAAYLPLDPGYPEDRLRFMVSDSGTRVVVADAVTGARLGPELVVVDPAVPGEVDTELRRRIHGPEDLAYLIYTSGSTGLPKGVRLEHRNVVSFFAGMDRVIDHDPPGTWLAVTSLSFDISVLELLWTLTRGFHVVVKRESGFRVAPQPAPAVGQRPVAMSLFHFAAGGEQASDGYRLLLESAEWADAHGFEAVWTPERHFHDFGAPYPNPSVVAAAVATRTKRVHLRAGSVVLPLHSPVRVAEEWSVVDNLSGGRVGISFAAGWQPNDFVLNPSALTGAKDALPGLIDTVRRLWRGEAVTLPGADGHEVPVRTLPRPVQPELPVWLTSAGSPATFERAGTLGLNVLTHLLGQSIDQLRANIARYRAAWQAAGHRGDGQVTLMLHTFLDEDAERAREMARRPLEGYLGAAVGLLKDLASAFPTFAGSGADADEAFRSLSEDEVSQLLAVAAERYLSTSGLFGTVDDAVEMIERVAAVGVDEVACLVDFGIPTDQVLGGLPLLAEVHDRVRSLRAEAATTGQPVPDDDSVAALVARHRVTHLQCTPSLAAMLVANPPDRAALSTVSHLLLGGEAMPLALATELRSLLPGRFTNMYGPTETTIWSLTHELDRVPDEVVPIGRPIANTSVLVLDSEGRQLPVGCFGELHLGGDGVARGYHERPELTAARFVERDGFGRCYATGDVVRVHPQGWVEFGGRIDHQVKIRGHRIELGEIEAVLDTHPAVVQSVLAAVGELEPRLVAYVVLRQDVSASPDELRAYVAATLPDVMVPSAVVMLDSLPLTPNGKVDRSRLPRQVAVAPAPSSEPVAPPANDLERLVADVWAGELGRAPGRDDSFFEIGGHSLLAVKVFRRLTDATGLPLALTDVFRYPTVRTFAAHLESVGAAGPRDAEVSSRPTGTDRGELRRRALSRRGGGTP